ncbi:MAG: hypothetical protein EBU08_15245 [Micrococcales bacterium]|nr:hypothetical protein [Micrococcales bacterium]
MMNNTELLNYLQDKVGELFENIRHDDTYGDFRDGAKDYLIQITDIIAELQRENLNESGN